MRQVHAGTFEGQAHSRRMSDAIRSGDDRNHSQASRHAAFTAPTLSNTRFDQRLPRRNWMTVSIGFNSGLYGGRGNKTIGSISESYVRVV